MKRCALALLLVLLATPVNSKTLKPVDWQRLSECLPNIAEVDGFVKESVEGDSYPQPYASVYYVKPGEGEPDADSSEMAQSLLLSITDCANATDYLHSMLELSFMDMPISINGKYEGKKTLEQSDFTIQCGYAFVVKNRFLVELSSSGKVDFFDQLDKLIADMKLEQLERIK